MPISDKTILSPHPPRPGVPLRRSTFIVLVALVLSMALGLSLLVPGGGLASGAGASAEAGSPPVHFGKHQAIDDELASAQARAETPRQQDGSVPTLPMPQAPGVPSLPGVPALPPLRHGGGVRFSAEPLVPPAALASVGASGAAAADPAAEATVRLEYEARVRLAKALAHDFSEPAAAPRAAPGAAPSPALHDVHADRATAASEALQPQLDNLRRTAENLAAPNASVTRGPAAWLRDYADSTAARPPAVLQARPLAHELVLLQGKVIPAVLTRDLVSDLPGRLSAMVSAPVYDSLGRGALLVPMGSLLVGSYDSAIAEGQSRLMMAFERLILPDGTSFDLPAAPGSDLAGAAGATGSVNRHFLQKFSSALFIAVLADRVRQPAQVTQVGASSLPTAAGQVLVDVSRGMLEQNRGIKPTLTIPAGTRVHVEVTSDMAFARPSGRPSSP